MSKKEFDPDDLFVDPEGIVEDIDVSEIATVYGGGGHVKASGSPMSNTLKREVIKSIFKDYAMFN